MDAVNSSDSLVAQIPCRADTGRAKVPESWRACWACTSTEREDESTGQQAVLSWWSCPLEPAGLSWERMALQLTAFEGTYARPAPPGSVMHSVQEQQPAAAPHSLAGGQSFCFCSTCAWACQLLQRRADHSRRTQAGAANQACRAHCSPDVRSQVVRKAGLRSNRLNR